MKLEKILDKEISEKKETFWEKYRLPIYTFLAYAAYALGGGVGQ